MEILLVDIMEPRATVEKFIGENGYDMTVLMDEAGLAANLYGVGSHPTTFIVAPSGELVGSAVGYREWDRAEMRAIIDSLLAGERPGEA
jgi:(2Fe-2S) ferredoxin